MRYILSALTLLLVLHGCGPEAGMESKDVDSNAVSLSDEDSRNAQLRQQKEQYAEQEKQLEAQRESIERQKAEQERQQKEQEPLRRRQLIAQQLPSNSYPSASGEECRAGFERRGVTLDAADRVKIGPAPLGSVAAWCIPTP